MGCLIKEVVKNILLNLLNRFYYVSFSIIKFILMARVIKKVKKKKPEPTQFWGRVKLPVDTVAGIYSAVGFKTGKFRTVQFSPKSPGTANAVRLGYVDADEVAWAHEGVAEKVGPGVYLGGRGALSMKSPLETDQDYIRLIRKGVTKKSIDFLMEAADIPAVEMAEIMEITPRKLAAIKPDTLMEKSQSEKAVNIARLYALGEEVFGSKEEFNKWMNGRVPSLGKKRPKEYLDTSSGINLLMEEIGRIQHGVYS